jgi:hypothetical protein
MIAYRNYFSACLLAAAALFLGATPSWGQSGFAVLGSAAVSCTDGNITGQVGTNQSATDVPPGAVTLVTCPTGGVHVGDTAAKQAFAQFLTNYDMLTPKAGDAPCTEILTGTLAGRSLSPGTYCFPAAATLTGVLTLNGPSTASWIFKVGSTLATPPALPTGALTGTNFSVVMAGGAQACNVTWWVAEAATMTDSNLKGSVLAGMATTFTRGTLIGADFAKAGATITGTAIVGCSVGVPGPGPGPQPDPRQCSDRVTGGGHIEAGYGKANFGITAGMSRKGKLRGHLTYIDHGADLKVKGTKVTAYVVVDARTRHIEGTATINGVAGSYMVDVTDNGEPGKHDKFAITLSTGYSKSATLAGGNIQLHKRHCKDDKGHHGHDRDDDDDDDNEDDHGDDEKKHKHSPKPYDKKRS